MSWSAVELEAILHYYWCPDKQFRNCDTDTPTTSVKNACETMAGKGMLERVGTYSYKITDKGRVFVDALEATPEPVQIWAVPT